MQFNWEKIGIRTRVDKNRLQIFDPFRKRYIYVTPEEEVRQFTLYRLTRELGYPAATIAVEKQIRYQNLAKRFDILIYDGAQPQLLIECKAPDVPLTQKVFDQLAAYNHVLSVPNVAITNGKNTVFAQLKSSPDQYVYSNYFPPFGSLTF